jgi:hypothetical protein
MLKFWFGLGIVFLLPGAIILYLVGYLGLNASADTCDFSQMHPNAMNLYSYLSSISVFRLSSSVDARLFALSIHEIKDVFNWLAVHSS